MEQEKELLFKQLLKSKAYLLDLIIIIVLSLITVITVFVLPNGNIFRIILGIVLLLFCPGYTLVSFLWPKKNEMSDLERIVLSFGLSISIAILFGLVFNYTPVGITLNPILFSLFGFIVATSLLGMYRRARIAEEERFSLRLDLIILKGKLSKVDKIITILIITSLVIAGAVLGYVAITPKHKDQYTEFYILDINGTTNNYPKNLTVGESEALIVGMVNHEGVRTCYTVIINLLNETEYKTDSWNFTVYLNDSERLERNFIFSIASNGTYELEFLLFREIDNDPYCEVHLNDIIAKD